MTFDKSQSTFPSTFCRDVWWWAVGLVPPSASLTDEVKAQCSPDVLEGCYQWYDYFNVLCEDMYTHENEYLPASPRQFRDILENISAGGELRGDDSVWGALDWDTYGKKLNKSKAYVTGSITLEQCLQTLTRTGLQCIHSIDHVVFSHSQYPKIFHAMRTMEQSPNVRDTPVRYHFAHCEFRQLFKNYAANYDELLRRASDESLSVAHAIHNFIKPMKIQRYIHFGIIKYKHKGIRVLDFNMYGNEYPTLRVNMGTCASPDTDISKDAYYQVLLGQSRDIQDTFIKNLAACDDPNHKRYPVTINGHEEMICPCSRLKLNPFKEDLDAVLAFITARKASIDQHAT